MVTVEIDKKIIGANNSTYFVAEAGLNHNGDVRIAKKMIDEAYASGADAIKFQTYKTENFLAESSQYFKFFKNVELAYEDFGELYDHAKTVGITFFSAPFDIASADYLKKIGVPCFKIASSDLTNFPLTRHIARMQLPMIISTGLATLQEIEEVVNACNHEGNNKIVLLHCVANYPTLPEEANLLAIEKMKAKFGLPVGYSDNGESVLVDLVAASLGASLIEKHFTLDKKMEGPDHFFSIDPAGLKGLISQLKLIEKMRGTGIKSPQSSEISNRNAIRKSITASANLKKGDVLSEGNMSVKRPGIGIESKYWDRLIGKKLVNDIRKDTPIKWEDIS